MRRLIILALLLGATQLIQPLGSAGLGSQTLIAFGILVLGAYAAGELLAAARLPKIVGYIVGGVVFGPSVVGVVTTQAADSLSSVSSLAIALIAFLAGAELRWEELKRLGSTILRILASEITLTFAAITLAVFLARRFVPFLDGAGTTEALAFSLIFASVASVHSPAVTLALLSETKAQGPLSRAVLGVVLSSDPVIVLMLTVTLAIGHVLVPGAGASVPVLAQAWSVLGAVIIGALLGGAVALYLRFVRRDLFVFAIMIAFFGAELARITHVEPLLLLIAAGFVSENISQREHGAALREAMDRAAAPVFVVFFGLAGAHISLPGLAKMWPIVIPIALLRGASIWTGCRIGTRWAKLTSPESAPVRRWLWTGLVSQAGVAIGLATVVANSYPGRGAQIRDMLLALLAVNEMVGAILFRRTLTLSGEARDREPRHTPVNAISGAVELQG